MLEVYIVMLEAYLNTMKNPKIANVRLYDDQSKQND